MLENNDKNNDNEKVEKLSENEVIITVEANQNFDKQQSTDQESESINQSAQQNQENILDKYIEKKEDDSKPKLSRLFFFSLFGIILGFVVFGIGLLIINSDKLLAFTSEMRCVPQECHGLKFTCGYNVPKCDNKYVIGDRCRKYAKCGFLEGRCTEIFMDKFYACRQCVEECKKKHIEELAELTACEANCEMGKGF
ncbi:MAG: hypothetical protein N3E37_05910 [Candidatus Micrarchaeota archaeon]|nr:hypothetical protein [Candidatus Micrarchaeota archaeon]